MLGIGPNEVLDVSITEVVWCSVCLADFSKLARFGQVVESGTDALGSMLQLFMPSSMLSAFLPLANTKKNR